MLSVWVAMMIKQQKTCFWNWWLFPLLSETQLLLSKHQFVIYNNRKITTIVWKYFCHLLYLPFPCYCKSNTGWLLAVLDNFKWYHNWSYQCPSSRSIHNLAMMTFLYVSGHMIDCIHKLPGHFSFSPDTPTGAYIICKDIRVPTDRTLQLTNTDGTQVPLRCTTSSKGTQHLGVYISMDGNSQAEIKILYKRCQLLCKFYQQCPLTRKEATVVYQAIFLPTIMYPFPATNIPQQALKKAQSLTTPIILSKIGFNRNTPTAIVYTSISHRGIRLCNLHNEQGVQQTLQIIKHLHTQTTLGKMVNLAIKAYQMMSGIEDTILEFTDPLPWMPNRWITNVQQFLHKI